MLWGIGAPRHETQRLFLPTSFTQGTEPAQGAWTSPGPCQEFVKSKVTKKKKKGGVGEGGSKKRAEQRN